MSTAIVGTVEPGLLDGLRSIALEHGGQVDSYEHLSDARRGLGTMAGRTTRCLLLKAPLRTAAPFVASLRRSADLFATPVMFLVDAITDHALRDAFSVGVDDVVCINDRAAVAARLRSLAEFDPNLRPPVEHGKVVVLHADRNRRTIVGRLMRMAGFEVHFASGPDEAQELANDVKPRLVIAEGSTLGASIWRAALPSCRIVLLDRTASTSTFEDGLAIIPDPAPIDNLLFAANELLQGASRDTRRSARVLFAAACGFRCPGARTQDWGLTYNMSEEGLFVRSFAAPASGTTVWLELSPPEAEPMHLRGRVMWVRHPGLAEGLSPPGFGVRLDLGACPAEDRVEYQRLYRSLRRRCRKGQPSTRSAFGLSRPFAPSHSPEQPPVQC